MIDPGVDQGGMKKRVDRGADHPDTLLDLPEEDTAPADLGADQGCLSRVLTRQRVACGLTK